MVVASNPGDESNMGLRPIPDPTTLTTEQLILAINNLEKLLMTKLEDNKTLYLEKFILTEQHRIEQKKDTKDAVDAALSAAKEAVRENNSAFTTATNKSEKAFADQLAQLTVTYNTGIKSVEDKVDDVKNRVGTLESLKQGAHDSLTGIYAAIAASVGVIGLIVVLVNVLVRK